MKSKLTGITILFLMVSPLLMAGDLASFINLGFSTNGRYFLFAQYGVETKSTYPYAELALVDVANNKFVSSGVKRSQYNVLTEPGNTGLGALLMLLKENNSMLKNYAIDFLKTGRILYLLVNGSSQITEDLFFRDFITDQQYQVNLHQKQQHTGENIKAAFYIDLTITLQSGTNKKYQIGLPDYYRENTIDYRIRQIILAPDGSSLIFLIEKELIDKTNNEGHNVRYMVETMRLY